MNKTLLSEYVDACELVKETEQEIKKLRKKRNTIAQESVKGSNPDYPYQPQHFHIAGTTYTYNDDIQLRIEEEILKERKKKAEEVKLEVEAYINTIPLRMQRIIKYRFFEGLSWEQIADKIGKKATGNGIRMELERFIRKN